ncbi:putative coiled-coil domain-containing protein [Apostichopus japonicus]|uniref:Putative coiled-coil domain-containing protein n=1 Tax=Stichopus japonicus TaxID=307972 RepID=A0A2G8L732_STIJA|nr:putative coiled-coil domain-containing protein [Apostichopus japonicus]
MSSEVEKAGSKPSKQVNDSDTSLVSTWLASYENFIGVKDVKEAQERVSMTEKEFLETRQQVKDSRQELEDIQSDLHLIRTRLDRTPRDDPKFLEYATEEHKTIQTEKQVNERHHRLLDKERETFDRLSAAVRESHVKQKAQEEKTKYWSIIGSVVGTVLGIIGSTFISQRRTKDLKGMVNDLKEQISFLDGGAGDELKTILQDLKKMTPADNSGTGLGDVSQKIINQTGSQLKSQEEVFSQLLEKHEKSFHDELKGVHRAISMGGGSGDMSTFEELIGNAEQKLEWEVKMSTLATVVMVYGAFALTVPVLYNIFK